ncbi:MAG TPA: YfhO family protein [Roseiflexaceae bacterium]|nr:YfhO family protein [Roseiflexaceae bacterium]
MAPLAVKSGRRLPILLPALALCMLALMLMWRPMLRGEVFLPLDALMHLHPWRYSYERVAVNSPGNTDPIKQVYPRREWTTNVIRQGAWPLWNPTVLTGTPNLPDGQIGLFYPPTLLFLLVPLAQAFGLYAFLHVIMAGAGAFCFARQLKLGAWPALLASVCYMFNGYILTWLYFPHHTGATAVLPWCFWAIERAVRGERWSRWMPASVIFALPLLSHLQLALYIYLGMGGYVLGRALQAQHWHARCRIVAGFCAAVALALALSAVQLLPAFELSAQGQRGEAGFEQTAAQAQFLYLLQLALPTLGGTPRAAPPAWGPDVLRTPMPYIGIVPLLLAVTALLFSRHQASFLLGVLAIGAFVLAIDSPLLQLFATLVPMYRQFEDHTRWFVLWYFTTSMLAGLGAWQLLQRGAAAEAGAGWVRLANRALLGGTALAALGWSLWHLQLLTPQSRYGIYITLIRQQSLLVPLTIAAIGLLALALLLAPRLPQAGRSVALALAIGVTAFDLLWYGGAYNTSVDLAALRPTSDLTAGLANYPPPTDDQLYPPTRQVAFLLNQPKPFRILGGDYTALSPNFASVFGIEDIRGYQSLYFERYNRLARLVDGKDYTRTGEGSVNLRAYFSSAYNKRRLLDMLNVEYLLFQPGSPNEQLFAPLELAQETDEGRIYRNPNVLPRAWLVHDIAVIAGDDEQLDRMARADFNPAALAILPSAPPPLAAPTSPESVPTIDYAPNRATVRARVNAPALLVVSDAYSDDWHVMVDGQPATLYRANYAFRGVWLPPGEHLVEFSYAPSAFLIGGAISSATLAGLVAYAIWNWLRRSRAAR